ncbi:Metal-response element-binding transcription factor 2 [Eumeta japonica]|uniref:Metal-response element-binding transcription factor 2 n=1 Tax=Eumeta variegata TaxID=151549 RepID=A0A4C1YPK0_EUMVA|nr:Metal-response element-binding transcription factor 2 [Eumeta japonica]
MDIKADIEVSTQLSIIDVILSDLDKKISPCTDKKNEKKEEETQDAMPDSTTNTEKTNTNSFHCGDDVLVPNKDGRYYLGTIIELSTSNNNDSCEVGSGEAQCLIKFGDGTRSWAACSTLKLLSAPPPGERRVLCVVCKARGGDEVLSCDMCGRGYHAKCHTPPVQDWSDGTSWHCRRCVDQRYRVAAAESRALKRSDFCRFKGSQHRRRQDLTPPCDTASTTSSTASDFGRTQNTKHCYCGEKSDWLAQMLLCCRCSCWFHQRCVSSLQYPLYAGDKLYIFACANCNGGHEYLRRLELSWVELAHLALYNLTAYNAPNYFDLDTVIMPYICDNWHALQLPEKMWRTPSHERRERILTALTSSRKRFKCGREMKKRATIWGLRLRRPPPPPHHLTQLEQVPKGTALTDEIVREYAPRLKYVPRSTPADDSLQPSSSNNKSLYDNNRHMIVPVDGHWINLMMGKRFHESLNSNSENDSTSSYESIKPNEPSASPEQGSPAVTTSAADERSHSAELHADKDTDQAKQSYEESQVPSLDSSLVQCSVKMDKLPADSENKEASNKSVDDINVITHTSRIATMNLEVSKLSTKNIIEHSKIMSLQHMSYNQYYNNRFHNENESSGDESSGRGTLDAIIPPLKDFQGKNNPFLMQNRYVSKKNLNSAKTPYSVAVNLFNRPRLVNGVSRVAHVGPFNPLMGPLVRPLKRKLSEKDIIIGPNGEVKRRKFRRPRKYLQMTKMCSIPNDPSKTVRLQTENADAGSPPAVKVHGRRLRQRQEKNYCDGARRSGGSGASAAGTNSNANNSVKSLQLSPHKCTEASAMARSDQLSELKTSVQEYFRADQRFRVLARRLTPAAPPAYLIEWESHPA